MLQISIRCPPSCSTRKRAENNVEDKRTSLSSVACLVRIVHFAVDNASVFCSVVVLRLQWQAGERQDRNGVRVYCIVYLYSYSISSNFIV